MYVHIQTGEGSVKSQRKAFYYVPPSKPHQASFLYRFVHALNTYLLNVRIYWMSGFFGLLSFGLQLHTFFLSQLIICLELQPSTYDWEFLIGCVKIKNDLWSSRSSKMEHGSQQTQHLLFCMEGSSRNSCSLSALINTPWYCWWFLLWFLYALYKLQHENNTCRIPRHMLSR